MVVGAGAFVDDVVAADEVVVTEVSGSVLVVASDDADVVPGSAVVAGEVAVVSGTPVVAAGLVVVDGYSVPAAVVPGASPSITAGSEVAGGEETRTTVGTTDESTAAGVDAPPPHDATIIETTIANAHQRRDAGGRWLRPSCR